MTAIAVTAAGTLMHNARSATRLCATVTHFATLGENHCGKSRGKQQDMLVQAGNLFQR